MNYGYNLFKLQDLQKICLVANYLNYSANFIDKYANQSTDFTFEEGELKEIAQQLMSKYRLEIIKNPETEENMGYQVTSQIKST